MQAVAAITLLLVVCSVNALFGGVVDDIKKGAGKVIDKGEEVIKGVEKKLDKVVDKKCAEDCGKSSGPGCLTCAAGLITCGPPCAVPQSPLCIACAASNGIKCAASCLIPFGQCIDKNKCLK